MGNLDLFFYNYFVLFAIAALDFFDIFTIISYMLKKIFSKIMSWLPAGTKKTEEPGPQTPPEGPGANHDFTEFFRSSTPVDVTERINESGNTIYAGRPTREQALREFNQHEETPDFQGIAEVQRGEDDILEVLSDLKEMPTKPPRKDKNLPSSIIIDKSGK